MYIYIYIQDLMPVIKSNIYQYIIINLPTELVA